MRKVIKYDGYVSEFVDDKVVCVFLNGDKGEFIMDVPLSEFKDPKELRVGSILSLSCINKIDVHSGTVNLPGMKKDSLSSE